MVPKYLTEITQQRFINVQLQINYPLCLYIKNTPEVPTVSLPHLKFPTNDRDKTKREQFNEPIHYMNDSFNNNPMPYTTGV